MSNADDRCACGSLSCDFYARLSHAQDANSAWRKIVAQPLRYGPHAFVEPATQPAPSGDEAKVREIVEKWTSVTWDRSFGRLVPVAAIARDAYAAGKADGAREGLSAGFAIAEDNAEISTHDGWHVTAPAIEWSDARKKLADAIARRGSEGK